MTLLSSSPESYSGARAEERRRPGLFARLVSSLNAFSLRMGRRSMSYPNIDRQREQRG
jgi:hypothetical protein